MIGQLYTTGQKRAVIAYLTKKTMSTFLKLATLGAHVPSNNERQAALFLNIGHQYTV